MGKLIILVFVITSFTGCAVLGPNSSGPRKAYAYDESKSYALNVMTAASRAERLHDMERPENFANVNPDSKLLSETFDVAYLAMTWSALSAAGGAFTILSSGSNKKYPKGYPQIFAWIPRSEARTGNDAKILVRKLMRDAVQSMLSEDGYLEKDGPYRGRKVYIGEGCSFTQGKKACTASLWINTLEASGQKLSGKFIVSSQIPKFVEIEKKGYFTESIRLNSYLGLSFWAFPKNGPSLTERYIEISKKLPKWMFMYLPQRTSKENKQGYPNLPILINQGKIHYFFKPE